MGAEPYWYFVKHDTDIDGALQDLRRREFEAGRYCPRIDFLWEMFPLTANSPAPGPAHASIEEAIEASAESGTRSILDLDHVSPYPDFCAVAPLDKAILRELYGTDQPTRAMVEANMDFMESMERGQGTYVVIYKDGAPDEVLFAGYSFD